MGFESPILVAYCTGVMLLLGLCMGSFLNCLAWRMTHGESVLHGRSHCTTCGHALGPLDLIPVVSWAASRGRCRYCGERVSWRYPATELLCGLLYVSVFLTHGFSLETIELVTFGSVLLVLSLTDLDDYIIPNATIIAAIVIRVAYVAAATICGQDGLALARDSLVGGLVVGVPVYVLSLAMDKVLGRESLGGGDIKLLFVAGLYFGFAQGLFIVLASCVLGIVMGAAGARASAGNTAQGEKRKGGLIPFGPAIALACWICMLVGEPIVSWYLALFLG